MWEYLVYAGAALGLLLFIVAACGASICCALWAISSIPSDEEDEARPYTI